jgi:hypothetical protein
MDASARMINDVKAAVVEGVTASRGDDIGTILGGGIVAYAGVTKNQMVFVTMHKRLTDREEYDSDHEEEPPHRLVMGYSSRNKTFTVVTLAPGLDDRSERYRRFYSDITRVSETDDIYILRLITGFGSIDYMINARKKTSERLLNHGMDLAPDMDPALSEFDVTITFRDTDVFE